MHTDRGTRLQLNLHRWLFTLLLLCALGLFAWLGQQYNWQADWTANQRNSLSRGSIELLGTLDGAVSVNVYTRDDPTMQAAVSEIMERYQRVKDDFSFRLVNPDIDIETAERDGVEQYGEVIVRYAGRRERITSLSEQAISSALLRLASDGGKHVVFLSGHGERDPEEANNRGYSKLGASLEDKGFTVSRVNLLQEALPEDTRILVIAGAGNDFLPGELERIEAFIDVHGNLLWLADPGELFGLEPLADALALKFHAGMVVDNNVDLRRTLRIEHPAIVPVLEYYPHAVSRGISYNTLFPLARGVEPGPAGADSEWQHSILWRSFERSWSESGAIGDEIVFATADGDIAGPVTLAVAAERLITGVDADKASQRVIVVGDSDFMANAYIGVGANLDLARNLFDWLAGDDDLIAIDVKDANDLQLQLSDTQVLLIGGGFLVVLPAALVIIGSMIWYRRKRR